MIVSCGLCGREGVRGGIDMQWKEHIIFVLGRNEVQDYYMQKLSNESYCVSLFT